MSESPLSRAGRWFLRSGIQDPSGGVARYYRSDLQRNHAISTEITGYTVSALLFLRAATDEDQYFHRAGAAARFLCDTWDGASMPFETGASDNQFAYFFDAGIVVRGLLATWRATNETRFLQVARSLGSAMAADFATSTGAYHPILALPGKQPAKHDPARWSHAPGCYQLKSALAWWELSQDVGEPRFGSLYNGSVETALRGYGSFLPGHPERAKVVDRLHAFLYFLEGLLPRAAEKRAAAALCHGISLVADYVRQTAPEFERSDVYAQLLRIRLYADGAGAAPLDRDAATREAALLAEFQVVSSDPRTDGGFYFGRRGTSWLPYVNPVSTAFAVQALALWDRYQSGGGPADPRLLI